MQPAINHRFKEEGYFLMILQEPNQKIRTVYRKRYLIMAQHFVHYSECLHSRILTNHDKGLRFQQISEILILFNIVESLLSMQPIIYFSIFFFHFLYNLGHNEMLHFENDSLAKSLLISFFKSLEINCKDLNVKQVDAVCIKCKTKFRCHIFVVPRKHGRQYL